MGDQKIVFTEKNGSFGKEILYVKPKDQNLITSTSIESSLKDNIKFSIRNVFTEIFLPQGYPNSVSEDYVDYQIWDTAQAFCSTVTGILSTKAVMSGVGVGNVEATPLAATITWVLKDGTGHIGRIGFAWWKCTSLDADCKMWRLVADILNDMALCLELCLPLFGGYTTAVLCVSTAMKAIVGVAGGATRAALTQHHAIRGNLGDVAAKDGSQETAVNLIASMIAILIISIYENNVWILFFIFTALHLFSNYMAIKSVCLTSLNKKRFLHVLNDRLQGNPIPNPKIVNKNEAIFYDDLTEKTICDYEIHIGKSVKKLSNQFTYDNMDYLINLHKKDNYLPIVDVQLRQIYVVLKDAITTEEILASYYYAVKLGILLSIHHGKTDIPSYFKDLINEKYRCSCQGLKDCTQLQIIKHLKDELSVEWKNISADMKKSGWSLEKQFILMDEWKAKW